MLKKWFGKKKKDEAAEAPAAEPSTADQTPGESPAAAEGDTATSKAATGETSVSETAATDAVASEPAATEAEAPAPATAEQKSETSEDPPKKVSMWARLKRGLSKTRQGLTSLFTGRKLDDDFVDELESQLYATDFGPATVSELLDGEKGVRAAWKAKEIETTEQVRDYLKDQLKGLLKKRETKLQIEGKQPAVILVAGVNGTGKTTSIAKIAHQLKSEGKSVVLAAADTFRAAAVEQLTIWSERIGVEIVTGPDSADPASVAFKGAEKALEMNADVLIVDTAGRLHTQQNLMRELEKIRSVLAKKIPDAPHESLLVLDATTGQNAINQAENFTAAVQVTGIILSKLDGTAKGGIVITVNNRLEIPVKFVGVGEQIEDLQVFDPDSFVEALFDDA